MITRYLLSALSNKGDSQEKSSWSVCSIILMLAGASSLIITQILLGYSFFLYMVDKYPTFSYPVLLLITAGLFTVLTIIFLFTVTKLIHYEACKANKLQLLLSAFVNGFNNHK